MSGLRDSFWIARAGDLAAVARRWAGTAEIALDTEFVFERTYRPRLGLIQIAANSEIALVDPLPLPDLSPLATLLADPGIEKVAHAAGGDLSALATRITTPVAPLFDTQIAAAFCGLGGGLSCAALVRTLTGVELGKHETRTDWLRRPLSAEQLLYAADDVAHLPAVADELRSRLRALGRLEWAREESRESVRSALDPVDPDAAWSRLRGLEKLTPRARRIARELAAWREREARRQDLARPFLMRDETLVALAGKEAFDPAAASKLPGYDPRRHEARLSEWAAAVATAVTVAEHGAELPAPAAPTKAERALGKALAELVAQRAVELALPVDLLLSRRARERLLTARSAGARLAEEVSGWRREALGAELERLDG